MAVTTVDQQALWEDPRRWGALRRARALKLVSAALLVTATLALVPAVWIVAMPEDPLLRPDLTHGPAVAALVICLLMLYVGRRIARGARATYGTDLYHCISHARQAGVPAGMIFDIELPQIFPRILFARRHRMMAVALPYPMLIAIDDISMVTVTADGFIRLDMKDERKHPVHLLAGDGLSPQSPDETRYQADRLSEFIFMPHNTRTDEEVQQDEIAAAFLANPKLR